MNKFNIKKFYPEETTVIKTKLSPSEIMLKLSEVVRSQKRFSGSVVSDNRKPYEGELNELDFKICKTKDNHSGGGMVIYTKGKIIETDEGYSIEITAGHEVFEIKMLFLALVGGAVFYAVKDFPSLGMKAFQPLGIIALMLLFVYGVSIGYIKQEAGKHIAFIREIIESNTEFDLPKYQKRERKEMLKWVGIGIFCVICAMVIAILFGIFFVPDFF